jgi:hypothetical protein
MMWFLSGVGDVSTPIVRSNIWDCVESYAIRMLLACRLKIIPTSNLKLIISFLVLLILVLSLLQVVITCYLEQQAHLTLHTVLILANRPSAQFRNSSNQGQLWGPYLPFLKLRKSISPTVEAPNQK